MEHHIGKIAVCGKLFGMILTYLFLSCDPARAQVQSRAPDQPPTPLYLDPLWIYPTPEEMENLESQRGGGPSFEEQVLMLINEERWTNGQLPPLKLVAQLNNAAEGHATAMATRNFFAHCDLDTNSQPGTRITAAGYAWNSIGENIAAGQSTPQQVVDGWMASSGHRANILSTTFWEVGHGYFLDSGDSANIRVETTGDCLADLFNQGPFFRYWVQNFGRRNGDYPMVINREAYETEDPTVDLYLYGQGFANEMRIRNENDAWTPWQPFAANTSWNLSPGNGIKEVQVEIRNGANVETASDTIILNALCTGQTQFMELFEDWWVNGIDVVDLTNTLANLCP